MLKVNHVHGGSERSLAMCFWAVSNLWLPSHLMRWKHRNTTMRPRWDGQAFPAPSPYMGFSPACCCGASPLRALPLMATSLSMAQELPNKEKEVYTVLSLLKSIYWSRPLAHLLQLALRKRPLVLNWWVNLPVVSDISAVCGNQLED